MITKSLSEFVANLDLDEVSAAAILTAKKSIIDTLGNIVAASHFGEGSDAIVRYVTDMGGIKEARIIPFGQRVPATNAAFANGALAHALDFDDVMEGPPGHVALGVIPSALAAAERTGAVSGRRFLTAVVAGSEVVCRLGEALISNKENASLPLFLVPQVLGYFGATAAAGHVLALDSEKLWSAFGLTLMQAAGTMETIYGSSSVGKNIYGGFANQGGMQSVLLAEMGVMEKDAVFEGQANLFATHFSEAKAGNTLLENLGTRFLSEKRWFKVWPSSSTTHPFVEAALNIAAKEGFDPNAIERVVVHVGRWGKAFCEPLDERRKPRNSAIAKNSIPFVVAKAIVNGDLKVEDFTEIGLNQPEILRMTEKIDYEFNADLDSLGEDPPGIVDIFTQNGDSISARVDIPLGHPSRPLTWDGIVRKYKDLIAASTVPLEPKKIQRSIDLIDTLEDLNDVSEIVDCVVVE
ncbi:MAG: MmgE/PrpD family protein [Chloroflexi bacterium]|nr:MmgE/PrpD family protein [Chloroflexota bacterium]